MSFIRKPPKAPAINQDSDAEISAPPFSAPPFRHIGEDVAVVIDRTMREPTAAEIDDLRAMWWRCRSNGVRLPSERGVIVVNGGNPKLHRQHLDERRVGKVFPATNAESGT